MSAEARIEHFTQLCHLFGLKDPQITVNDDTLTAVDVEVRIRMIHILGDHPDRLYAGRITSKKMINEFPCTGG